MRKLSDKSWNVEPGQDYFLDAVSRYFREFAKGAFLMGISYQQLAAALQAAMIDEAHKKHIALADQGSAEAVNYSAVFAITGIPRANIQRQLNATDDLSSPQGVRKRKEPMLSHFVKKWETEFKGEALAYGRSRDPNTLMGLINTVRGEQGLEKEVRGKGVFDALKLSGMIYPSKTEPEKWELNSNAFKGFGSPDGVSDDFYFLRENVGDHLASAMSNVLVSTGSAEGSVLRKMYERSVGSAVSPKAVTLRRINENFEKRAGSFFKDIGELIEEAEPSFAAPKPNDRPEDARFRVGVYLWAPELLEGDVAT